MIAFLLRYTPHKELMKDLVVGLEEAMRRKGKRLKWFSYARKSTQKGYYFFIHKQIDWYLLDEILTRVHSKHPKLQKNLVADMLSELVNLREKDVRYLHTLLV